MATQNIDLITETTGKRMASALEAIAHTQINKDIIDYQAIANIVRNGEADKVFNIGEMINTKYTTETGTEYVLPWHICDFRDVTLKNGDVVPGMIIQCHFATPEEVQFDCPETGCPDENRATYGYNRWSQSFVRQWLNSRGKSYFVAKNDYDQPPEVIPRGFMDNFDDAFLQILKPVKVTTALNTVESGLPESEDTYDTFFLPSLEEMYVSPQLGGGVEGTALKYWKEVSGRTSPFEWHPKVYPELIHLGLDDNQPDYVWFRSATRSYSCHPWFVNPTGYVNYANARSAFHSAPLAVIC